MQTNPFCEQDPQYNQGITIPLPYASSDTHLLVRAALFGLKRIYRPGFAYKKMGGMLIDTGPAASQQLSLLPQHGAGDKSQRLMQVMNKLNGRYGATPYQFFQQKTANLEPCAGKTCRPATPPAGRMYRWRMPGRAANSRGVTLTPN